MISHRWMSSIFVSGPVLHWVGAGAAACGASPAPSTWVPTELVNAKHEDWQFCPDCQKKREAAS